MKRFLIGILCGMLAIGTFAGCGNTKDDSKQEEQSAENELDLSAEDAGYDSIDWDSEPYSHAPDPNTDKVNIAMENDSFVNVIIHDVSQSGFKKYVELCKQMGYTENSFYDTSYFNAENKDGYSIQMMYITKDEYGDDSDWTDDQDKTIDLSIYRPINVSTDESSTTAGDANAVDTSSETQTTDSTGIRPEVKEFLDSYESFMNEYADFMEKYENSDDVASMMKDYSDYMAKYADFTQKYEDLGNDDLNDEELKYYVDVQSRVTKRLIDVAN